MYAYPSLPTLVDLDSYLSNDCKITYLVRKKRLCLWYICWSWFVRLQGMKKICSFSGLIPTKQWITFILKNLSLPSWSKRSCSSYKWANLANEVKEGWRRRRRRRRRKEALWPNFLPYPSPSHLEQVWFFSEFSFRIGRTIKHFQRGDVGTSNESIREILWGKQKPKGRGGDECASLINRIPSWEGWLPHQSGRDENWGPRQYQSHFFCCLLHHLLLLLPLLLPLLPPQIEWIKMGLQV